MKKPPMAERLLARLKKLGMPERKAKEIAKDLAPMAIRAKVSGTVTGKLEAKLLDLGLSERKAKELAKGLAVTVRASIKAKVQSAKQTLDDVTDEDVNTVVKKVTDDVDDDELDKVAPRVNGHRVRLDLPVVGVYGMKAIELLRVMDGLSSNRSYLVAAVKGEEGIVAVRQFTPDSYKVKFYPTMQYWKRTPDELSTLGATGYLDRRSQNLYERMMVNQDTLNLLLEQLDAESKPKLTRLIHRYLAVTGRTLIKAFGYLHQRVRVGAVA